MVSAGHVPTHEAGPLAAVVLLLDGVLTNNYLLNTFLAQTGAQGDRMSAAAGYYAQNSLKRVSAAFCKKRGQVSKQTSKQARKHADKQAGKHADKQAGKQTGKQESKQVSR